MRLFSAIALPDEIAAGLAQYRGGLHDARWVEPADYHVTLAFFGELGGSLANELAEALSAIDIAAFDLRLTALSVFGADRPHAIVATAEKTPPLLALEAAHRAICARIGIRLETRKYTPHVTLARLRNTFAGEVAAWMNQQPVFPGWTWRADRFAMYSSRTSRGGGPYVAEVGFPLKAD